MDKLTFSYAHHTETTAVAALINSAYRGDVSRLGWTTEADLLEGRRIDEARILDLLNTGTTTIPSFLGHKSRSGRIRCEAPI